MNRANDRTEARLLRLFLNMRTPINFATFQPESRREGQL
jgi:hypothetical protein